MIVWSVAALDICLMAWQEHSKEHILKNSPCRQFARDKKLQEHLTRQLLQDAYQEERFAKEEEELTDLFEENYASIKRENQAAI